MEINTIYIDCSNSMLFHCKFLSFICVQIYFFILYCIIYYCFTFNKNCIVKIKEKIIIIIIYILIIE